MASTKLDLEAAEATSLLWWMGQGLQQGLVGQRHRGRDTLPDHSLTCDGGEKGHCHLRYSEDIMGLEEEGGCLRTCSQPL